MSKKLLYVIFPLYLFIFKSAFAQNKSITGLVIDSNANVVLKNASIILLQAKDSIIIADTRAGIDGKFSLKGLSDTIPLLLLFTYPRYTSFSLAIDLKKSKSLEYDLNNVNLILKAKLLEEIIVKSSAIKIKGDTTEYIAGSYKVQPNASVEDLLKQLPGLQIDEYGNITAQGQKVKKVLVDGEEFFSDDPTLVTRNFRANIIDKIQVYDRKSDASNFSGIEDGIRDKTINFKIKVDKTHGYFGKIDLGIGSNEKYSGQGIINSFKNKRKISLFLTTGNIGRTGLGAADKQKLGTDEEGNGNYSGKGKPNITSGGIHYDNKWNNDKETINGNYKFNISHIEGEEIVASQNNLSEGIIYNKINKQFKNNSKNQVINTQYLHKLDSTSTLKIYSSGSLENSNNKQSSVSDSQRDNGSQLFNNISFIDNKFNSNNFKLNLSWEKRLKKVGRTISMYFDNNFTKTNSTGISNSKNNFYDDQSNLDSIKIQNLIRQSHSNYRENNLKAIYTEPINKRFSLIINYYSGIIESEDNLLSFNSGPINVIDSTFSSYFNTVTWDNKAGLFLNYGSNKTSINIGNTVGKMFLNITNLFNNFELSKSYANLNPTADINYKFSNYKNLRFTYNGKTISPEKTQLQPYKYNNSQLVTFRSNFNLKNSFQNSFNVEYKSYKILSEIYLNTFAYYNITSDPISLSLEVAPSGIYNYKYENIIGHIKSDYSMFGAISKKIKQWNLQTGLFGVISGGKNYSLINNNLNKLDYNSYLGGVNFYFIKPQKYDKNLKFTCSYTENKSSIQRQLSDNYLTYSVNYTSNIYILKKIQINSDANYMWQQKSKAFNDNFDRLIWNAWLGVNFLKNNELTIKFSCNDILNENKGYERSASNTFFTESQYTTIKRYFMIGASWNFNKFKNIKQ